MNDIRRFFTKKNKSPTSNPTELSHSEKDNIVEKTPINIKKGPLDLGPVEGSPSKSPTSNPTELSHCEKINIVEKSPINIKKGPLDLGSIDGSPCQPVLAKFPLTTFGKQSRAFSTSNYKLYNWIEYSVENDAVFCFPCRHFGSQEEDEQFRKKGCKNWKKIGEKLKKHSNSVSHMENVIKWKDYEKSKKKGSILTQMSSAHKGIIENNRKSIKSLAEICLLLARQGMAFRGHDESDKSSNRGNFIEMCEVLSKHDEEFSAMYKKCINYTSWQVQNELLEILAHENLTTILGEVGKSKIFAIMVDEARVGRKEQLALCVRYTLGLEIKERFIKFVDCSGKTTASELFLLIKKELDDLKLSDFHLVGQSYDGAAVMSGQIGGLQAKIKEVFPNALYTHCMAHRVNLALVDSCKNVRSIGHLFNSLEALYEHFSKPQHHVKYKDIIHDLGIKPMELSQLSDTRWVSRFKSCAAVKNCYSALINLLQQEIDERRSGQAVTAIGLLSCMREPSFIVHLIVLEEILTILNILSEALQSKNSTLGSAAKVVEGVILTLESIRADSTYENIHKKIVLFANEADISLDPPTSKRKKQISTKVKDFVIDSTLGATEGGAIPNVVEYWRANVFYRILDSIIGFLKTRFSKESLIIGKAVDQFFKLDFDGSIPFIDHYFKHFHLDKNVLKAEMMVVRNVLIKANKEINYDNIKNELNPEIYPSLVILFKVALTLPVSSATCERSFSVMRIILNWLRLNMSQDRFSALATLFIERDINIDLHKVVDKYALKDRKMSLTY